MVLGARVRVTEFEPEVMMAALASSRATDGGGERMAPAEVLAGWVRKVRWGAATV